MNAKTYRGVVGICAWLMALSVLVPSLAMMVRAEGEETENFSQEQNQIADLNDQYKDLQTKQQAIQAEINKAKNEKDKKIAVSQQIGNQIDNTTAQIDLLTDRIDLLESNIAKKEIEMKDKQAEIDTNYELFKKRFRAMTKTPQGSALGIVLGAQSYSQFVNRTEITSRVAGYDRNLIAKLNLQKAELEQIKQEIEENKKDVEGDKSEMDEKKQELDAQMLETKKQIQDVSAMEQEYLANKEAIEAEMTKLQKQMDAIYAEIARKSTRATYVGGQMALPVPTLTQISSPYGPRFLDGSNFHTGIDFFGPGAFGTSILAANSGEVALVNTVVTGSGYSGGYGKYLIVDHGGGITTLYAHCSAINVKEGDVVTAGQVIAQVGSTGWSTGPHLHFEVRENGAHTNPSKYLYG